MRHGIMAGGNWIVDHVKLITSWPEQDALTNIVREFQGNGGSAYNILKDVARLGAKFPLQGIGQIGDDDNGRHILRDCTANGIDTRQLRICATQPTSYTDVMTVAATGRRTFFHQRGANATLDDPDFDFDGTTAKIFHLGYLLLLDTLDELVDGVPRAAGVFRRAKAAGLVTSLDCVSEDSQRFPQVVLPVLPDVDILFANDFEAARLTGTGLRVGDVIQHDAVATAAARLLQAGVQRWVVLHFPEGTYAAARTGATLWQPSMLLPAAEIAGAAGAGDALAAGVLYGLHEDWPMDRNLRLGVCAAAASLRHPTCSEGIPPLAECWAMGERYGFPANVAAGIEAGCPGTSAR